MKRILIYRVGHLGDTVVVLPAMHAIRKHFANAELTLLSAHHVSKNYVLPNELL